MGQPSTKTQLLSNSFYNLCPLPPYIKLVIYINRGITQDLNYMFGTIWKDRFTGYNFLTRDVLTMKQSTTSIT